MLILPSRKIAPEKFLADFLATLRPGVIKRADFIPWADIVAKLDVYGHAIEFFRQMDAESLQKSPQQVADALLSADDPSEYIILGFELLGHTSDLFVTFEDNTKISELCSAIAKDNEKAALELVRLWKELGLQNVLRTDVASTWIGVQIGLAYERRKKAGGKAFSGHIEELLKQTIRELRLPDDSLKNEHRIDLGSNGQKKVDFAIEVGGKTRVAFEVNFYTVSGSKPTEIKRAYADLNRNLEQLGITLVWITDGIGYQKMRKSLTDAFRVHPNTYNYHMASTHLNSDLENLKKTW